MAQRWAGGAVGVLLALTGCGGDDPAAPSTTDAAGNGTPSTPATTPTAPTAPPAMTGPAPALPTTLLSYADLENPVPAHFRNGPNGPGAPNGVAVALDNMPATNPVSDAGATLGRVLFYDRRLSRNDRISCGSCHLQAVGFADTAQFSRGFLGGRTGRHSMALANARYYASGRFFWDERAATLEAQVLQPIQDTVEMGMTLDSLERKLATTSYYAALFEAAFGTRDVTRDRIARALGQFVRSMTSYRAKFDRTFAAPGQPATAVFTADEARGQQLFGGVAGCARCHTTAAQVGDQARNTGLDAAVTDAGVGGGRFKTPSLRNVGVRSRFMHDGRFTSLEQVVEFYNSGVQGNPNLDQRLRAPGPGGLPQRLNLPDADKRALVAFLHTLTDSTFLRDARFADPFPRP